MQWSILPLGLLGLLNVFLAFTATQRVEGARGAAVVFGAAALLIGWGLWQPNPWLVAVGLYLSIDAPMNMGLLLHGRINWRHVLTRLVIVALFFMLWMNFRPT